VAFGVPAVAEVVGDAGVVVPAFDTTAFAAALRELCGDDQRREQLAHAARRRFDEQFELSAVVDRIEELYTALARRGTS
jgi:glycosyltransferase involved in cell wall biosynthesis